ncbi:DUF4190 domain-containing protein [Streptomyces sp. NPDC046942]|uniref:DUF4190 domain-containing protein n=1 Tax=Streptomyces sp. NPDC046942 TaxID=3155137 RepID=UPI0033C9DB25
MSDEVPQSIPPEQQPAGTGPRSPWVSLGKTTDTAPATPQDSPPTLTAPGPGSVHDQQTLTSLPTDAVPAAWAPPIAAPAPATPANPFAPPANSFTPPANPFTPSADPFAAPTVAPPAPANPFAPPMAQHPATEPVPPPPIAPDGPGQVPYGYPGTPSAYGHPGAYPAASAYGWPGMQPLPSNGMGTAALVCGILAAVGFLLWPIALVLGILAVIFGAVGRGKAKRGEATNPGMALAGLICGVAGIVLVLGFWAFVIALM